MLARPVDSAIVDARAPWSVKCSVVANATAAGRGSSLLSAIRAADIVCLLVKGCRGSLAPDGSGTPCTRRMHEVLPSSLRRRGLPGERRLPLRDRGLRNRVGE